MNGSSSRPAARCRFRCRRNPRRRRKQQLLAFFDDLERELEKVEFFRPPDKRETMQINLRNIFTRMPPTQQDIRTLHGVITGDRRRAARGRRGAACSMARRRSCCARCWPSTAGPACRASAVRCAGCRGCCAAIRPMPSARCGTRSPRTGALPAYGFKRQTPVGAHITDFVSFPLRMVIDIVPDQEEASAAVQRAERRAWLTERDYRVMEDAGERDRRRCRAGARSASRPRSASFDLRHRLRQKLLHHLPICSSDCATPLASKSLRTLFSTAVSPPSSKSAITTSLA